MSETMPSWLKSMQNGSIGETRAKAFLIDRFWILERSVDIEGADLIIQRRITNKNLLDPRPPNLGFVQVKFFEAENTTLSISSEYILDNERKPRLDFFLLLHTGFEENAKVFYLTTEDIVEEFRRSEYRGRDFYKISAGYIVKSNKFLVGHRSRTLDRIEARLALAEFKKNREFISWKLPSVISDTSAILPEYNENLENTLRYIPKEFQRIKENAVKALIDVEKKYFELKDITDELDPILAFYKIQSLRADLRGGYWGAWGEQLMDQLYDENFYYTCRIHKEKIETLRNDGLLDSYITARMELEEKIIEFISQNLPIDPNTIYAMIIKVSITDFRIESITHRLVRACEYFHIPEIISNFGYIDIQRNSHKGIKNISQDTFEYYWLAGRIDPKEKQKENPINYYKTNFYFYFDICLDKLYDMKYCL